MLCCCLVVHSAKDSSRLVWLYTHMCSEGERDSEGERARARASKRASEGGQRDRGSVRERERE